MDAKEPRVMSILKIAHLGHPVLRQVAREVTPASLASAAVQSFIDDLIETMLEYDGVGLAAPQVHASSRIVAYLPSDQRGGRASEPRVLVNPVLEPATEEMEEDWEGCLSLPDLRGRVPRYTKLRVTALDREGKSLAFTAKDFHARVVQHECDHLDGRVFLDRMRDLSTLAFLPEFLRYADVDGDVEG
jgi:peptide deformylase